MSILKNNKQVISNAHCLICNIMLYSDKIQGQLEVMSLFHMQTTSTKIDISGLLSGIIGKVVSAHQSHSDIICKRCFNLLDHIDYLQDELFTAKEQIISEYEQTEDFYSFKNKDMGLHDKIYEKISYATFLESDSSRESFSTRNERTRVLLNNDTGKQRKEKIRKTECSKDLIPVKKIDFVKYEEGEVIDNAVNEESSQDTKKDDARNIRTRSKRPAAAAAERDENSHSKYNVAFSTCSDCAKNIIVCTTLRLHLMKDHSVAEFEVDEVVLKQWIKRKLLKYDNKSLKLICPWCQEVCNIFQDYYEHLYTLHLDPSYEKYCQLVQAFTERKIVCPLCDNTFKSVLSLDDHLDVSHSDVACRTCLVCQEECIGKGALLRHVSHHILGVQKCPICACRYSTQRQFSSHLEFFHENKYSVKCTQCASTFTSYSLYEKHKNAEHSLVHEVSRPLIESLIDGCNAKGDDAVLSCKMETDSESNFTCDKCNINFTFRSQFERHLYNTHPSLFKYRCEECECLFKVYGDLISHQMSHFVGFHHCPHCNAKFSKVDQIKKHLKYSHPFVKGLECKLCIKNFKSYDTYLNHLKLKHPEVSGKALLDVQCSVCDKKFVNSYQLHLHEKNHQKGLSVCTICEKTVKNLTLHMNSHTKLLTYDCNDCGAKYSNKSGLIVHRKRVHLGDSVKKHQCKECNKKFMCKADLKIHTSGVHEGLRSYKCDYCEKAYKNKVSLVYHERKHTGIKPHECTLCKKSFTTPTLLKQHVGNDHKAVYKGIYFKKKERDETERKPSNIVHINIPKDMRKEVVASWDQEQLDGEKILTIDG